MVPKNLVPLDKCSPTNFRIPTACPPGQSDQIGWRPFIYGDRIGWGLFVQRDQLIRYPLCGTKCVAANIFCFIQNEVLKVRLSFGFFITFEVNIQVILGQFTTNGLMCKADDQNNREKVLPGRCIHYTCRT